SAYSQHVSFFISVTKNSEESDINKNSNISLNDQSIKINKNDQSFLNYNDQNTSIPEEGGNQSISILKGDIQSISFSIDNDEFIFDDILKNTLEESESESKVNTDYPNKVYGDLMALVINYKLSNKTDNII
ncbi:12593_t:CDS:2, partial [Funneliformis caledonium]